MADNIRRGENGFRLSRFGLIVTPRGKKCEQPKYPIPQRVIQMKPEQLRLNDSEQESFLKIARFVLVC